MFSCNEKMLGCKSVRWQQWRLVRIHMTFTWKSPLKKNVSSSHTNTCCMPALHAQTKCVQCIHGKSNKNNKQIFCRTFTFAVERLLSKSTSCCLHQLNVSHCINRKSMIKKKKNTNLLQHFCSRKTSLKINIVPLAPWTYLQFWSGHAILMLKGDKVPQPHTIHLLIF